MKKIHWGKTLISFFLLTTLFLTACTDNTPDSKTTDGEDDSTVLNVDVDERYTEYVRAIVADFEKENDVKVEITEKNMFDSIEALPLDGPAGIGTDVLIAPYDRIGILGEQGHLTEVTLPNDERYDKMDENQVLSNGKIYGAPFVIETLVMFYNKDLVDTAPKTFDDLEELAKNDQFAFENEKGKNTAFLANWVTPYHYLGLITGYGGYIFGDNGKDTTDIGLNTPEAIEAIEYASKWYQDIWPKGALDATSAENFMNDQFTANKTAAVINGPWGAASYKEAGLNYGVATIPTLQNNKTYQPFAGGTGWTISSYTKNKDLAQKWLDFVNNAENTKQLYELTAEIPANQETRKAISNGDDELTNAVIEQYNSAVPMPNIPEMEEVWTGTESMIFDAASGNKTAKEAADDTVKLIKDNIKQKYEGKE
ncbi:MAG: extracellular solute-binding protein [Carnobacterium sp.]|uniref:extracellular solute-binding protein n=1 Tax=Carnobacterium sp. TaxID=48221 RepID=UPI003C734A4B